MLAADVDIGPAWVAFLGAVVGATASILAQYLTSRATLRQARDQRTHERALAAEDRAEQREHDRLVDQANVLQELQFAIQRLIRAVSATHHEDEKQFRSNGGRWRGTRVSSHWSLESHLAGVATRMLLLRVRDEALRLVITPVTAAAAVMETATTYDESFRRLVTIMEDANVAQDAISVAMSDLPPPTAFKPLIESPMNEIGDSSS